jgi:hypothetical protein
LSWGAFCSFTRKSATNSDDQVFSRDADYAGTKWKERRTALSFVEIISGLEGTPALAWGSLCP